MRCEYGVLLLRFLWRGILPLFAATLALLFAFLSARPAPEPIALALTTHVEEQDPGDEPRWPDNTYLRHSLMARVAPEFVDVPWFIDSIAQYHDGFVDWESQLVPGLVAMRFPRGNAVEAAEHMSQTVFFSKVHLSRRGSFRTGALLRTDCPGGERIPNDPNFGLQAYLKNTGQSIGNGNCPGQSVCGYTPVLGHDIRATFAWYRATDCSGKIIAVVDAGVAYNHPDFQHADGSSNIWRNPGEWGDDGNGGRKETNGIDDDNNGIIDDVHDAMFQAYCCGLNVHCHNFQEDPANPVPCIVVPGLCGADWPKGDPRCANRVSAHGTKVASIIGAAADNGRDVAGVCWRARILSAAVAPQYNKGAGALDCNSHTCFLGDEQIGYIQAMEYAMLMGASIINCSWGFTVEPLGLKELFDYAQLNDILIVVISHNNGVNLDAIQYQTPGTSYAPIQPIPALFKREFRYDNVIVVTGLALDGTFPQNFSYGLNTVDIAAYSPCNVVIAPDAQDPSYCFCESFGGTSAAAPQVAGAAGLIWTANPALTACDVVAKILDTARRPEGNGLAGRCATEGVLDLNAALP